MKKNLSIFNFKFPGAFAAALIVCFCLFFGDLFLPVNTFTHRLWEALIVHKFQSWLPGPFYPNQKISMTEQGDLAPYTRFSVKKLVSWETDRYGYRKEDSENRDYPVVIVGDSTTLGTGLDQKDMLSEKLEGMIKKPVYPFAPYYEMNSYLDSFFYKNHPPKIVIFSMMEWALPDLIEQSRTERASAMGRPLESYRHQTMGVMLDRVSKLSFMRFLTARVKGYIKNHFVDPPFKTVQTDEGWMVFPQGKSAHQELPLKKIPEIIQVLKRYQSELKSRGIEMYFLPVPNKESLYYRLISGRQVPVFYLTLAENARSAGIPTLNLLELFANTRVKSNNLLYHLDDSHWNRYGVELAAQGIAEMLKASEKNAGTQDSAP